VRRYPQKWRKGTPVFRPEKLTLDPSGASHGMYSSCRRDIGFDVVESFDDILEETEKNVIEQKAEKRGGRGYLPVIGAMRTVRSCFLFNFLNFLLNSSIV